MRTKNQNGIRTRNAGMETTFREIVNGREIVNPECFELFRRWSEC